jgi:hypothetical protein
VRSSSGSQQFYQCAAGAARQKNASREKNHNFLQVAGRHLFRITKELVLQPVEYSTHSSPTSNVAPLLLPSEDTADVADCAADAAR